MNQPIKLAEKLPLLADSIIFPDRGPTLIRWGQVLRTTPVASQLLTDARSKGRLVPLSHLARVRSGVVTRANAFFLAHEIPFDQVPIRFHLTRRDYASIAVILDGKDSPHRIARRHLHKVVKGPESLIGPTDISHSDLRLVAVEDSPEALTAARDSDTKAYLRRGETIDYSVSEDKKKGGIPAQRANIKNRKPYWYSLNVPARTLGRLVVPEHFDQRFIATALTGEYLDYVVIDTCYVVESHDPTHQQFLLAALNSLMTWYQIELRGRTQHGEGVLKVKIPDFQGVLVLDPESLSKTERAAVVSAFEPIAHRRTLIVQEELAQEDRTEFDSTYLRVVGIPPSRLDKTRRLIATELREAMEERRTRPESVAELKAQKAPRQRATGMIDAFAARIVSSISPYPDPRHSMPEKSFTVPIPIMPFQGPVDVGLGLFDSNSVLAGSEVVAETRSTNEARFVCAVLTIEPTLPTIDVPTNDLIEILQKWEKDVATWWLEFSKASSTITEQITDTKLVDAVKARALELCHASELPLEVSPLNARGASKKSVRR